MGFFVTFNWEVSRKIRAPEDEIEGADTYTRVFGTYGAAWVVLLIRVIDTGLVALVGWHLGLAPWFYVALVALFLVCLVGSSTTGSIPAEKRPSGWSSTRGCTSSPLTSSWRPRLRGSGNRIEATPPR